MEKYFRLHQLSRLICMQVRQRSTSTLNNVFTSNLQPASLNGNNALNWAVLGENGVESVRALISMGFDVNHRNKKKKTPLMQASEMGNVRAVKLLLEAGADPTARGKLKHIHSIQFYSTSPPFR